MPNEYPEYYLDSAATQKPYDSVVSTVSKTMKNNWHNASAVYQKGIDARNIIESVREQIANDINAEPEEIIFTSGACESNTLALCCTPSPVTLTTTPIEHKSIQMIIDDVYEHTSHILSVDNCGKLKLAPDSIDRMYQDNLICPRFGDIVSIQSANGEIGIIQDMKEVASIFRPDTCIHTDATQLFPYQKIDVKKLNLSMMSVSAQKFHGPQGIGFLYKRKDIFLKPLIYGSQEHGLRGGTYNTALIAGMGKALSVHRNNPKTNILRETMQLIHDNIIDIGNGSIELIGPPIGKERLPNNLCFRLHDIKAKDMVSALDIYNIQISAGSACNSGNEQPSHVLTAIGLASNEADEVIRITIDSTISNTDLNRFFKTFAVVFKSIPKKNPYQEFLKE